MHNNEKNINCNFRGFYNGDYHTIANHNTMLSNDVQKFSLKSNNR